MNFHRVLLHELHERHGTTREIAEVCSMSESDVLLQLMDLNTRTKRLLRRSDDPITASPAGSWLADGVAGLLRLNQEVELEVVPKYLSPESSTWRLDFFLIALLVRAGHLLFHDEISSDIADRGDLATLVARSLLSQCAQNARRPIRQYRRTRALEFSLDGDVEWETVYLPDADGFNLSRLALSLRNPYFATIKAAADILKGEVTDTDTGGALEQLSRSLGPQDTPPFRFPHLPQRYASWSAAYRLSQLIIQGLGIDLAGGEFSGPGFVLSTWRSWEQLCTEVLRRALPGHGLLVQHGWVLGRRGNQPVFAYPDISFGRGGGLSSVLIDAKYKTRAGTTPAITRTDLSEAITFMHASGRSRTDLMFPSPKPTSSLALGEWSVFDTIETVGGWVIRGIEVQIQGIAERGGFDLVVDRARRQLVPHPDRPQATAAMDQQGPHVAGSYDCPVAEALGDVASSPQDR